MSLVRTEETRSELSTEEETNSESSTEEINRESSIEKINRGSPTEEKSRESSTEETCSESSTEETDCESSTECVVEDEFSFEPNDCNDTDVTVVVKGKELRFYKILLSLSSPVFDRMLKEKNTSSVIELDDYCHDDVALLFEQMHPALAGPIEELDLSLLMELADWYQVPHVAAKCGQYIAEQTHLLVLQEESRLKGDIIVTRSTTDPDPTLDKALLFLTLIRIYYDLLSDEPREPLLKLAATRSLRQLKSAHRYSYTPQDVKTDVVLKRCSLLEDSLRRRQRRAAELLRGLL